MNDREQYRDTVRRLSDRDAGRTARERECIEEAKRQLEHLARQLSYAPYLSDDDARFGALERGLHEFRRLTQGGGSQKEGVR